MNHMIYESQRQQVQDWRQSGGEVVVVIEEGDEGEEGADHEDEGCDFEAIQFLLYVKEDIAHHSQDQQDDSQGVSCEHTIAYHEWNQEGLQKEQFLIQLNESFFILVVIVIVIFFFRLLLHFLLRFLQILALLHGISIILGLLPRLDFLLVVKLIDQFVFLLILILVFILTVSISGVSIGGFFLIGQLFEFAILDLFGEAEDGEGEVEEEKEEEDGLEEDGAGVVGLGESGRGGQVGKVGDALVGCHEQPLECEIHHLLYGSNLL